MLSDCHCSYGDDHDLMAAVGHFVEVTPTQRSVKADLEYVCVM